MMKRAVLFFLFAVLISFCSSPFSVVCAMQDENSFADNTSELTMDLQNSVKLGVGKRVEIPFIATGSNQEIAFDVSQFGGCKRDFKWELFYPDQSESCSLFMEYRDNDFSMNYADRSIVSTSSNNEAMKVILDGYTAKLALSNFFDSVPSGSLSCPVSANRWQKGKDYFAMNVTLRYVSGNCDVELKFDRNKYKLERKPEDNMASTPSPVAAKASSNMLLYILVPLGVLLLLIILAVGILFLWRHLQSKKQVSNDVEGGRPAAIATAKEKLPSKESNALRQSKTLEVSRLSKNTGLKEKTCIAPSAEKTAVSKNTHEMLAELSESDSTERFEEILKKRITKKYRGKLLQQTPPPPSKVESVESFNEKSPVSQSVSSECREKYERKKKQANPHYNIESRFTLLKLKSERDARLREKIKSGAPLTAQEQFTKESWDIYARHNHDLLVDKMRYRAKRKKYKKKAKGSKSNDSPVFAKTEAQLAFEKEIDAARERYLVNLAKEEAQKDKNGINGQRLSVSTDEGKSQEKILYRILNGKRAKNGRSSKNPEENCADKSAEVALKKGEVQ